MIRTRWFPYGVSVLTVAAALLLTQLLQPLLEPSVFTLFYAAVVASSWFGGIGPGLLAIGLSLLADLLVIEPLYSVGTLSLNLLIRLVTFSLVSLLIALLCSELRSTKRKSETNLKSLQDLEAGLSRLVDSNLMGVYIANLDGSFLQANAAFLQMVGYTPEDLRHDRVRWREMTPPEYREISQQSLVELRARGTCAPFEKEYIRKDGSRVPVLLGGVTLREETVVGFVLDLSKCKRDEAALEETNQTLQALIQASPLAILSTDVKGQVKMWCPAAERLFGWTEPEVLGQPLPFVPQNQWNQFQELHRSRVAGISLAEIEMQGQKKDGSLIDIAIWIAPLHDDRGEVVSTVAVVADISERKRAEETSLLLSAIVESSEDAIIGFALDGKIISWNLGAEKMFGYTAAEAQGQNVLLLVPHDRQQEPICIFETVKRSEVITDFETVRLRKDGSLIDVSVAASPIRNGKGDLIGVSATIRDIGERKRAEQALRQSEERFQAFMNNSPAASWITDVDGRLLYFSETYRRTFKFLTDAPIGQSIFDLYPAEIAQSFLDNIRTVAQTNQVVEAVESAPRVDGTIGSFLVYKFPISEASNQRLVGGVAIDITERRRIEDEREKALQERQQAEQALQERSERLKLLSETAGALLSTEQPLTLMNDLFSKLSAQMDLHFYFNFLIDEHESRSMLRLASCGGISEEAAQAIRWIELGQSWCGVAAQERRQIVISDVQQSTHPNAHILRELGVTAFAGQPLIAQKRLLGTLAFASCTRTSFTSEEVALLQATSDQVALALERAELLASLQQQTEQLVQANRIKDEFLAVLSHELRTPLNPILGWSKLLRSKKHDQATIDRALETIERNAQLQTQLIGDLLDVSRILQGKLSLNVGPVDLASTIAAAIETVRLAAEAKSIQIQTLLDPAIGPVSGDAGRLQQVVWNLLSNAIKFTPSGGQVDIRLASLNAQALLEVRDTGKGISSDFLPYVFDTFRQADGATTRKFGGLGLGLAIVRHIIELHGGTVEAESAGEDQGAMFTVKLPLMRPYLEIHRNTRPSEEIPDLRGVKVLVVDDEADARELIAFTLEQSGADVIQVASADAALQVLAEYKPDVLLSDIGMPEVDGYTLMRQIRALEGHSLAGAHNLIAIALTAYAGEADQQQAFAAGFQYHLAKPIDPANLAIVVARSVNKLQ